MVAPESGAGAEAPEAFGERGGVARKEAPGASPLLQALGARLAGARKRAGLTRKTLAQRSGVSERHIAAVEGGRGNISVLLLGRLGDALGIGVPALLSDLDPGPPDGAPDPSDLVELLDMVRRADPAQQRRIRDEVARLLAAPGSDPRARRVALIGLRGAGKSTLGSAAAAELGVPFVELDREIEQESGLAVDEIFALYGADGYRRFEQRRLRDVVQRYACAIVAVGGGVVSEPETFALLRERFHTVWLRASPDEHMRRVLDQGDRRPMADNPRAMEALRAILEVREGLYARADASVDTAGRTVAESAQDLLAEVSRWLTEDEPVRRGAPRPRPRS